LAAINKSHSNIVTEQTLEATVLLETFGNAKSGGNRNASRFASCLDIHFAGESIVGSQIAECLLDKNRLVAQQSDERNFHVFYEMLAGFSASEKSKYGLQSADRYFYLNQGNACELDGKSDAHDFNRLLSALQVLGFTNDEQDALFRVLACVLHLGNVYFNRRTLPNGVEAVEIGSDAEIRWTCHLLQLNRDALVRTLTCQASDTRNDRILRPLTISQALDARDAIAKTLYAALFAWLVQRVNERTRATTGHCNTISLLDLFGFEAFENNSFEQLCINFAAERLEQLVFGHLFRSQQAEYVRERLSWSPIQQTDQSAVVLQLLAKKPTGILALLDDECNFPKSSDHSFLGQSFQSHFARQLATNDHF
jgi:myosin-15